MDQSMSDSVVPSYPESDVHVLHEDAETVTLQVTCSRTEFLEKSRKFDEQKAPKEEKRADVVATLQKVIEFIDEVCETELLFSRQVAKLAVQLVQQDVQQDAEPGQQETISSDSVMTIFDMIDRAIPVAKVPGKDPKEVAEGQRGKNGLCNTVWREVKGELVRVKKGRKGAEQGVVMRKWGYVWRKTEGLEGARAKQ
ncbi:uncharacterized protein KY384_001679 [Bacidia gigantensis]|uniref:uncharacterized protein n=1 Tax=Bacidia gigantensis TaxID=2732470 RepID=UPI001D0399B0|nr:uncharacterized protein KY384_001679 [Bacidia gigantensis]KAG8533938.1 hypothetical protein KY384_001679 [Bacidia gigantensis]